MNIDIGLKLQVEAIYELPLPELYKMKFDKIIIGKNIKAAIQILKSKDKGEKIACIKAEKEENVRVQAFKVLSFTPLYKLFTALRQNRLVKILKQKAAHLLVSTSIEEYRCLSKFDIFFIKLNNLLFTHQIAVSEQADKTNYYKLSYKSYKFSTNRLIYSIIKSGKSDDYQTFKSENDFTYKSEKTISLRQNQEISANKIIDCTNSNYQNPLNVFWFSYPNDEINLDKTIIVNIDKDNSINIIAWFDYIYVEFISKYEEVTQTDALLQIIYKQSININFHKNKILSSGFASFMPVDNKPLFYLSKRKENLSGSNFKFEYNPWKIMEFCDIKYDESKAILKSAQFFKKLFYKYGTEIDKIIYWAYEYWNELKDSEKVWLKAEVKYLIEEEYCSSTADYINNRTEEWLNPNQLNSEFIDSCF